MVIHTCDRCGKDFPKLAKLRIYLEQKNPCKLNIPNSITTPLQQNLATDQISIQTYVPIGNLIQLDDIPLLSIQSSDNASLRKHSFEFLTYLSQNDTEWFDNMEDKYNTNTDEKWPELARTLLYDYPKRNIINIEGNFGSKPI